MLYFRYILYMWVQPQVQKKVIGVAMAPLFIFTFLGTPANAVTGAQCTVSATTVREREPITYRVSTSPGNENISVEWLGAIAGQGEQQSVTYTRFGTYEVAIKVTDEQGAQVQATCPVVRVLETSGSDERQLFPSRNSTPTSIGEKLTGAINQLFKLTGAEMPEFPLALFSHEGTPFGGPIVQRIECTCSGNYLITVNDLYSRQSKNILVWPPFSRLYQHFVFNPGQQALGTYTPGPVCLIQTANGCYQVQTHGAINSGPGAGSSGPYEYMLEGEVPEGAQQTAQPAGTDWNGEGFSTTPNRVAIDTDGATEPPFFDPHYQSQTSYLNGQLDANYHNYVVVPIGSEIPLGTQVRLTNNTTGKSVMAIVGDRGPTANGLGEMSLNAARELGAWTEGMGNAASQHNVTWEFIGSNNR